MWGAAGRGVAVVTAVLAFCYLLQASDSVVPPAPKPSAAPVALPPILVAQGPVANKEYFFSKQWIIPFGAHTIQLPILMYHYIRTPPSPLVDILGYRLSVAPAVFEAQMSWLAANGYHPVTFDDVRAYFSGSRPLPPRPVVITFDDGYADLYTTAFPILKEHGFKAVAYIVSGFVGWPQYVTKDQILELDQYGIEIASHTVSHPNLARASMASVTFQVTASKHWLEALLGHPVLDFAYPSGQYNAQVIQALKAAGYDTAVTEVVSTTHSLNDRYTWTRVRVGVGESLSEFAASLGTPMLPVLVTTIEVVTPPAQPAPAPGA
jgi:peptidoglycan/xylan/chitin deacetylase (PgdA/CDA1 family)